MKTKNHPMFENVPEFMLQKTFLVGGAVRDLVMGRKPHDLDFVIVGACETDVQKLLELGFEQTGKQFPVFRQPETGWEFALARTEKKDGEGHTGFSVSFGPEVTLEQDLARRDLTINAMAIASDGTFVDPFGGWVDTVVNKVLHPISADVFAEDPLRIFRAARFAAQLGFEPSVDLEFAFASVSDADLLALPGERVWGELHKALKSAKPSLFFRTLADTRAMDLWFPEVKALIGAIQKPEFHPEGDAFEHTMIVCDLLAERNEGAGFVFAGLCHDLGKGLTQAVWPNHYKHDKLGVEPTNALCRRLKMPSMEGRLAEMVAEAHMLFWKFPEMSPGSKLDFLSKHKLKKPSHFEVLQVVCKADSDCKVAFIPECEDEEDDAFFLSSIRIEMAVNALAAADFSSVASAKDPAMAFRQAACEVLRNI
jgi:tRNA nucleotidyltransferase (CCA-adding enzyme)